MNQRGGLVVYIPDGTRAVTVYRAAVSSHNRSGDAAATRNYVDEPSDIQRLVNNLFDGRRVVGRLDAVVRTESLDMPEAVRDIVALLPPGRFTRRRLCDQLNSAITAHGYATWMGTVD